jgi:hypothetical protein
MILIMDVQGFEVENKKFILKEMASYNGKQICHYIFKSPFPHDMLSIDLKKRIQSDVDFHGVSWDIGFTPLHLFGKIMDNLSSSIESIYLSDRKKAMYIQQFTSKPVLEFGNVSLKKTTPSCLYHNEDDCVCALSNVYYLFEHYVMN